MKYILLTIFALLAVQAYSEENETPTFVQTSVQDHVVSEKDPNDLIGKSTDPKKTEATALIPALRDPDHPECTECLMAQQKSGTDLSQDANPSNSRKKLLKADRNTPLRPKPVGTGTQDDGDGQQ